MSVPDQSAIEAIHAHHRELADGLRTGVGQLLDAQVAGRPLAHTTAALLAFLDEELLPHAAAEEATLYPAADTGATALLVRAMREEHVELAGRVRQLRDAPLAIETATLASAILVLFESHVWKENELLVPALAADPDVSLPELLLGMHDLVSSSGPEPGGSSPPPKGETDMTDAIILDVREEPPVRRHPLIFDTFAALHPGAAFELINDHDPKPLYYQLAAEHTGTFTWDYLEQGPETWRVRIGRVATTSPSAA